MLSFRYHFSYSADHRSTPSYNRFNPTKACLRLLPASTSYLLHCSQLPQNIEEFSLLLPDFITMTDPITSMTNVTSSDGYDDASEAAVIALTAGVQALIGFAQLMTGIFVSTYFFFNRFFHGRAVPYYNHVALPYFNNHVLPVLHILLAGLLQLVKIGLQRATTAVTDMLTTLPKTATQATLNYSCTEVFWYAVILVSFLSTLLYRFMTVRMCLLWAAFLRRFHHFLARNFPFVFIHHPRRGRRHIPRYLFTDMLSPADTIIIPHKGEHTINQLQNHTIPLTTNVVNLVPTIGEASLGYHPNTIIQVSVPTRPAAVHTIEGELQVAIDTGVSEADATHNLIHAVEHRIQTVIRPNLVPLRPPAGATLATCVLTHPGQKELCIALQNVLAIRRNRRKLGALLPICLDQHVKIAEADHQNRGNRRRRLNQIHGTATVNLHWLNAPH